MKTKKMSNEAKTPALNKGAVSGSLLLHDLFQVANIKNDDGMPVIKYVDKPNGGSVAYVRHDAMVKKLNALLKQWTLTYGVYDKRNYYLIYTLYLTIE